MGSNVIDECPQDRCTHEGHQKPWYEKTNAPCRLPNRKHAVNETVPHPEYDNRAQQIDGHNGQRISQQVEKRNQYDEQIILEIIAMGTAVVGNKHMELKVQLEYDFRH